MIIHQNPKSSITEKKTSPFKKKINILAKKFSNDIYSFKKNSFIKDKTIQPFIEIREHYDNLDSKSKTINSQSLNNNNHNKIKYNLKNNPFNNKKIRISNNNAIVNEIIYENGSDKENIYNIPQTSRYNNIKEKYLQKFFECLNHNENINDNIIINNYSEVMNTINASSKRNKSTYINPIYKIKEKNNIHNISNISPINLEDELNYEFEIRLLKKKLKKKKKKNDKLKSELIKIKKYQKRKIEENKNNKKEHIILQVINIYKSLNSYNKDNYFTEENNGLSISISNTISNEIKNNDLGMFPATKLFKDILLNLMDLRYDYENSKLKEELINGIKNILDNNDNKDLINDTKSIINNIKKLLKKEIKLKANINKEKYLLLENKKYYDYFIYLCNKLHVNNLEKLNNLLKEIIIKSDVEFRQINQIKKIVMENTKSNYIEYDDNIDKIHENNNLNIYKQIKDYYNKEEKPYKIKNKNNSEGKININLSLKKRGEIKNYKRYSYFKDNNYMNKSLIHMNNNIFRNKNESFNKKKFYTYKYNDSIRKTKNRSLIKENENKKINLYEFIKQKDYDYHLKDYYNNKVFKNEENKKNDRIEVSHSIKNVKIKPFNSKKMIVKNKNYNSIINSKKKELEFKCKIKNKK